MPPAQPPKVAYCGKGSLVEVLMPEPTAAELRLELREREIEIAALKAKLQGQEAAMAVATRLLQPYTNRINGRG